MLCKNCGAVIPDDSVFCENCGIRIEEIDIQPEIQPDGFREEDAAAAPVTGFTETPAEEEPEAFSDAAETEMSEAAAEPETYGSAEETETFEAAAESETFVPAAEPEMFEMAPEPEVPEVVESEMPGAVDELLAELPEEEAAAEEPAPEAYQTETETAEEPAEEYFLEEEPAETVIPQSFEPVLTASSSDSSWWKNFEEMEPKAGDFGAGSADPGMPEEPQVPEWLTPAASSGARTEERSEPDDDVYAADRDDADEAEPEPIRTEPAEIETAADDASSLGEDDEEFFAKFETAAAAEYEEETAQGSDDDQDEYGYGAYDDPDAGEEPEEEEFSEEESEDLPEFDWNMSSSAEEEAPDNAPELPEEDRYEYDPYPETETDAKRRHFPWRAEDTQPFTREQEAEIAAADAPADDVESGYEEDGPDFSAETLKEDLKEQLDHLGEQTKAAAEKVENIAPVLMEKTEEVKEKAGRFWDKLQNKIGDVVESAMNKAEEAGLTGSEAGADPEEDSSHLREALDEVTEEFEELDGHLPEHTETESDHVRFDWNGQQNEYDTDEEEELPEGFDWNGTGRAADTDDAAYGADDSHEAADAGTEPETSIEDVSGTFLWTASDGSAKEEQPEADAEETEEFDWNMSDPSEEEEAAEPEEEAEFDWNMRDASDEEESAGPEEEEEFDWNMKEPSEEEDVAEPEEEEEFDWNMKDSSEEEPAAGPEEEPEFDWNMRTPSEETADSEKTEEFDWNMKLAPEEEEPAAGPSEDAEDAYPEAEPEYGEEPEAGDAEEENAAEHLKEELKEQIDHLGEQTKAAAEKVENIAPVLLEKTEEVKEKAGKFWGKFQKKVENMIESAGSKEDAPTEEADPPESGAPIEESDLSEDGAPREAARPFGTDAPAGGSEAAERPGSEEEPEAAEEAGPAEDKDQPWAGDAPKTGEAEHAEASVEDGAEESTVEPERIPEESTIEAEQEDREEAKDAEEAEAVHGPDVSASGDAQYTDPAEEASIENFAKWLGSIGKQVHTGTGWMAEAAIDKFRSMKKTHNSERSQWTEEEEGELQQTPGFWYRSRPEQTEDAPKEGEGSGMGEFEIPGGSAEEQNEDAPETGNVETESFAQAEEDVPLRGAADEAAGADAEAISADEAAGADAEAVSADEAADADAETTSEHEPEHAPEAAGPGTEDPSEETEAPDGDTEDTADTADEADHAAAEEEDIIMEHGKRSEEGVDDALKLSETVLYHEGEESTSLAEMTSGPGQRVPGMAGTGSSLTKQSGSRISRGRGFKIRVGVIAVLVAAVLVAGFILANKHEEVQVQKTNYEATLAEADQLVANNDPYSAEEIYLSLIAEFPDKSEPYEKLAQIYIEDEEYDKARDIIQKGIAAAGENSTFTSYLSDIDALTSTEWIRPYIRVLEDNRNSIENYEDSVEASVALCDVSGDKKPELFFFTKEYYGYGKLRIYTCVDGNAKEVTYDCKNRSTQYQDAFYDVRQNGNGYAVFKLKDPGKFAIYSSFLHGGVDAWQTTNEYEMNSMGGCKQSDVFEAKISTSYNQYAENDNDRSEYLQNEVPITYDSYMSLFNNMLNDIDQVILYNESAGGDGVVWEKITVDKVLCTSCEDMLDRLEEMDPENEDDDD